MVKSLTDRTFQLRRRPQELAARRPRHVPAALLDVADEAADGQGVGVRVVDPGSFRPWIRQESIPVQGAVARLLALRPELLRFLLRLRLS